MPTLELSLSDNQWVMLSYIRLLNRNCQQLKNMLQDFKNSASICDLNKLIYKKSYFNLKWIDMNLPLPLLGSHLLLNVSILNQGKTL